METHFKKRQATLQEALERSGLQALVLDHPSYIYHLTGWLPPSWVKAFAVTAAREVALVTPVDPGIPDPLWSQELRYQAFSLDEPVEALATASTALLEALSRAQALDGPVGMLSGSLPAGIALRLQEHVRLQDATGVLHAVTAVKDEAAQAAIRERVGFLDRAFETARECIAPGASELSVFGAIYTTLAEALGGPLTLDNCFGSGERALGDEPQPTNKLLVEGEVVMIDLFPQLGAYAADYTRNFVVGEPSAAQRAQHEVLERALGLAESLLRPGAVTGEIDRRVRGFLEEAGYGEFAYRHHTGHAFGLTTPEPPWLIPVDRSELRAGMVVAVEPGIYHPVHGGMRLEGNYLITEGVPESLTGFPARLIACG